jgi:hypothetical protein
VENSFQNFGSQNNNNNLLNLLTSLDQLPVQELRGVQAQLFRELERVTKVSLRIALFLYQTPPKSKKTNQDTSVFLLSLLPAYPRRRIETKTVTAELVSQDETTVVLRRVKLRIGDLQKTVWILFSLRNYLCEMTFFSSWQVYTLLSFMLQRTVENLENTGVNVDEEIKDALEQ